MLLWIESDTRFHDFHALGQVGRVYEIATASDHVEGHELEECAVLLIDGKPDSTHADMRDAQLFAQRLENNRLAVKPLGRAS